MALRDSGVSCPTRIDQGRPLIQFAVFSICVTAQDMNDRTDAPINEIAVFVAVAQSGSFTRAAEEIGSSKSNVGKAVQRLEARLGTKLFQRTTRAVRLTEDGETYLQAAQQALDALREADQHLASRRSEPAGRVKIDVPAGFGRLLLPSFIQLR